MNKLKNAIVYLSGPMDRVPDRGKKWREYIIPKLRDLGIGILNPLDKPFLHDSSEDDNFLKLCKELRDKKAEDEYADLINEVVCCPDLRMVDKSDFLIVYIDVDVHMAGTYHELVLAIQQKKPTLIMCKQGKWSVPGWWWGVIDHRYFFDDWESILEYLKHVDSGNHNRHWRFLDMNKVFNAS